MEFKTGYLYYVRFDDHTSGPKRKLADSQCVGWCIKNANSYAVFTWWLVEDEDRDFVNDNHEPFTIAKGTIKEYKQLRPKKFF